MQLEIEVKFLDLDHEQIRTKLNKLGAKLEIPMRTMRRVVFDYTDKRLGLAHEKLRVRDEGNVVTITYKSRSGNQYSNELETTVGSFDSMVELLKAIGLEGYSFQESKRETWHYRDSEIVLDEWPWLNPYIEIEGPDEAAIHQIANELGFDWKDGFFGNIDTAYRHQYPKMTQGDSVGDLAEVRFGTTLPDWLKERSA